MDISIERLVKSAQQARSQAHAPFSGFHVGAALLTGNGSLYTGCNIETSSLGLTLCAERVALFKAFSEGEREFRAVAIVSSAETTCPPCGACRQVLWDLAGDITVIMATPDGTVETTQLSDLLPKAFDQNVLNHTHHE
jgi:cytidine deaminase